MQGLEGGRVVDQTWHQSIVFVPVQVEASTYVVYETGVGLLPVGGVGLIFAPVVVYNLANEAYTILNNDVLDCTSDSEWTRGAC